MEALQVLQPVTVLIEVLESLGLPSSEREVVFHEDGLKPVHPSLEPVGLGWG